MTFEELQKVLSSKDGHLRVDASAAESSIPSIRSLVKDYFGGFFDVTLNPTFPQPSTFLYNGQSCNAVHVAGRLVSAFLGCKELTVEANFFLVNGGAEVVVTLTDPRDPWKLSSVFPQAQSSNLDSAFFHKCVFTLDSNRPFSLGHDFNALFQTEDGPPAFHDRDEQKTTGLYLTAQLQLSEVDEMLCDFLGNDNNRTLTVAGPVEFAETGPRMRLATNDPQLEIKSPAVSFSLPELQLSLELHYQFLTAPNSAGKIEIREQLNTTFTHENLKVPLRITFDPNSLTESMIVESFDRESPLTFGKLVSAIPGGIRTAIPKEIPVLDDLKLTNLSLEVSTAPFELRAVDFTVELGRDEGWTIVEDLLIFKGLALDISVLHDTNGWQVQPYVSGMLELAGGNLNVGVDVSAETFFCILDKDKPILLNNLFKKLKFDVGDLLKEEKDKAAKLDHLEVCGALDGSMYTLHIATQINWALVDKLSIERLFFSLEYEKGNDAPAVTLGGSLNIAGVTAEMLGRSSPTGGWQFEGSTGRDQEIKIGKLIDEGVKLFDPNVQLPAALESFSVKNLAVSFNTKSKDFKFSCQGTVQIEATEVDCLVTIEKTSDGAWFDGEVTVEDLKFTGKIRNEKSTQAFLLSYTPDPPGTSQGIEIKELVQKISQPIGDVMPELTIGLKHAMFAYEKAEKSAFLFGVGFDINATIDTSKWGPIGALLGGQEIGLDNLRVLVASTDFYTEQITALNELLPDGIEKISVVSSEDADKNGGKTKALTKGFNFSGKLKLGNLTPPPLMLPAPGAGDATGAGGGEAPAAGAAEEKPDTPKQPPAESSTAKWIDIKKSLGPLYLGRVGFRYQDQKIALLLDAAVDLAGLHVGLMGFQIRFPLSGSFDPLHDLDLDGLELAYATGPVQITGSFLRFRQEGKPDQYDGMALIKAADFMIAGLGSYTTVAGAPSLFIYAVLHAELGGPPFFRVQGLAAGFGYNRRLKLPPIEEVHNFPFVRAALDETFITKETPIQDVLSKLRDYITPSPGDYWLAAGIRFSSFEMIQSFALLSVSFGHDVEIGLLGLSKMSLPRGASPGSELAYAELALRVVVKPEEGTVAVEGRLTDASYILSKDCRLTGGFAFFLWSTGDHAGDFVVTLGGYHPKFVRPAHYPIVPRLGIHWQVSSELLVTAEMYFALTPSCLMVGGKMSAVYQSGCIKAWYVAYADFLLNWQPFYYKADMGISMGVHATLDLDIVVISIRVELSVDLHLWGPPFSGVAVVNLSVISFTIPFGQPQQLPNPLTPDEFVGAFLPPAQRDRQPEVIAVRIGSGLIQQRETEKDNRKEVVRVVNAHALALTAESLIPSTHFGGLATSAKYMEPNKPRPSIESFGIRPMGTSLTSTLNVRLLKGAEDQGTPENLRATLVENGVPDALWGRSPNGKVALPSIPEAKIFPATQGVYFSFLPFEPEHPLAPIPLEKLKYEQLPTKTVVWQDLGEALAIPAPKQNTFWNTIWGNKEVDNKRTAIIEILRRQSPFPLNELGLEQVQKSESHYFQSDPEFCNLGEQLN